MANTNKFNTNAVNTWCPGCPNFLIYESVKKALTNLTEKKYKQEDFAMVTGIGCHAKIFDYLKLSGIYSLHGRVIPTCFGIKIGNPNLKVIGFGGDGDTYDEGIAHLIHQCRYNSDTTMIVHNNQIFALTTGQPTPVSEKGFKHRLNIPLTESPFNPIKLVLSAGASFVARTSAMDLNHTSEIIEKAIEHKGFSFVEILQPCITFHDTRPVIKNNYKLENHNKEDLKKAFEKADEWDYNLSSASENKIPVGIFYQKQKPVFDDMQPQLAELKKKKVSWLDIKRDFKLTD